MKTRNVRVITNLRDVPADYHALSSYRRRGKHGRKTLAYVALQAAYAQGEIDAVKLIRGPRDIRGPVFIDSKQATAIVDRIETTTPRRNPRPEAATTSQLEQRQQTRAAWTATQSALVGILNAAERIATALEAAAPRIEAHAEIAAAIDNLTAAVRDDDADEEWADGAAEDRT